MSNLTVNLDRPHPTIRIRETVSVVQPDGSVIRFRGHRNATLKEAIERESNQDFRRRPSWNMRSEPGFQKWRRWLNMWMRSPIDAITLVLIDRNPPAVTLNYDDTDEWPSKRWDRALAEHRTKKRFRFLVGSDG